jgi:hypothetical protein
VRSRGWGGRGGRRSKGTLCSIFGICETMMVMIVAVMASNAAPLTPALLTRASHAYMYAQMHRACTELARRGEGAVVWSVKDALKKCMQKRMHACTHTR